MKDSKENKASLEWEVILAVTILYALMMGTLLAIHYLQPPALPVEQKL